MRRRIGRNKMTYAAQRFCAAMDRLLTVRSVSEKDRAVRWVRAWSTAYLARHERRRATPPEANLNGPDRRQRNRYRS